MNERERSELERLKQRHARLEQELASLAGQLKGFESRLQSPLETPPPASPPLSSPEPWGPSPELPPASPIPDSTTPSSAVPPVIGSDEQRPVDTAIGTTQRLRTALGREPEPEPLPQEAAPIPSRAESSVEQSFEMRFGRHWAPRIGIALVLTAFVFFANYAYQNFHMGAVGRVGLLYLGSATLIGAGWWWQRKAANPSLKNYAQVLFAGGLAAVYFTTYAAHHIERLRVIPNPILDGVLLLGWAGFMVWIADRKKSEVLALFGVGLAYYTCVITRVESFTLFSNLLLTVAAVFFLIRNRWSKLTIASLVATYAAYAYWRFYYGNEWHWADPEQGLWRGTYFLMSYWLVFTAAVFLSRHSEMAGRNRAMFLTLNNTGFFSLFVLTMLQVQQGGFWKFALIYGAVLLGLAEVARRILSAEPLSKNSYLTQGLVLVTVGIISHPRIAGLQLALLLGAESIVLLMLGYGRNNPILQIGAAVSGALAVGWGIDGLVRDDPHLRNLGIAVGAMMAFNSVVAHRRAKASLSPIRVVPAFFAIMALMIWVAATWYNTSDTSFPLALMIEALVLSLLFHALRVREFVLLGQGCVLLGQFALLLRIVASNNHAPWWNPALMIGISVGLSFWWQRQTIFPAESNTDSIAVSANLPVMAYRWGGIFMSVWWVNEYVPERERVWVLFLVGLVVFLWSGWRRNVESLLFAAAYSVFGFAMLWQPFHEVSIAYLPNVLAIVVWLAQQQMVRRMPQRYEVDHRISNVMIVLGGVSLWMLLYRWLHDTAIARSYLTASWSMLALVFFVTGMALRERMYRWLGLAVLSCTLGRVFIFDVWRLGALYRILSFLALGLALLVLGFLYNRYQEKIREWL